MVSFRVVWKKNTYSITFPLDERVSKLKEHIHTFTGDILREESDVSSWESSATNPKVQICIVGASTLESQCPVMSFLDKYITITVILLGRGRIRG